MSTLHYYYNPQNCLYQGSLFQTSFDPKMNFHRLFTVHGPGSPESLWARILGGQASGLQLERKPSETGAPLTLGPPAHRSVVAIRQRLVLCRQQRGAAPSHILLGWCGAAGLAEVGVYTGAGGVVEHPHGQGVVGELCRACGER